MLRNIAGIMADEEPKTAISASGLYNSSDLGSLTTNADLSSTLFNGASELTFMMWISVDDFSIFGNSGARPFVEFNPTTYPVVLGAGAVFATIANSNGGNTTATHLQSFSENTFYHICITQSLSNNRIRIYVNGALVTTAVMSYSNDSSSTSAIFKDETGVSVSQINTFNRELTEAEVAEHYVYDQDLMQSGVLGWDAMTPAQRSGLIYSSSYTDDISISGNEFNDKSGNGITISPQPSLTGEQIYFYTNASDLPSDTTVYDVNSTTLDGSSQYFSATDSGSLLDPADGDKTYTTWFNIDSADTGTYTFFSKNANSTVNKLDIVLTSGGVLFFRVFDGSGNTRDYWYTSGNNFRDSQWHFIAFRLNSYGAFDFNVDGVAYAMTQQLGGTITSPVTSSSPLLLGVNQNTTPSFIDYFKGSIYNSEVFDTTLTDSHCLEIYNAGITICYDGRDSAINSLSVYSPRLGNYNGNDGNELIDQSTSGITTTAIGSPTYTDQGLTVECTPSDTTVYPLSSMNTTGTGSVYTNDSSFNMSALKASGMSISMFVDTTSPNVNYLSNFSSDTSDATPVELALKIQGGSGNFTVEGYTGASFDTISTNTQITSQGLTHIGLTLNAGGSVATLYISGVAITTGNLSSLNVSSTGRLAIAEGQDGDLYQPTNGLKAMPRVTNREITASEMLYFAQNPSVCYADIDNTSGLKDAIIYAPTLGEYNGSVAQALIDPASGIITNEAGTVTYDGSGVSVECTS